MLALLKKLFTSEGKAEVRAEEPVRQHMLGGGHISHRTRYTPPGFFRFDLPFYPDPSDEFNTFVRVRGMWAGVCGSGALSTSVSVVNDGRTTQVCGYSPSNAQTCRLGISRPKIPHEFYSDGSGPKEESFYVYGNNIDAQEDAAERLI